MISGHAERMPRSLVRKLAATDPAEAAQRIFELQDRVERLRSQLAYALDALEGQPWTGWTTDDASEALWEGKQRP